MYKFLIVFLFLISTQLNAQQTVCNDVSDTTRFYYTPQFINVNESQLEAYFSEDGTDVFTINRKTHNITTLEGVYHFKYVPTTFDEEYYYYNGFKLTIFLGKDGRYLYHKKIKNF